MVDTQTFEMDDEGTPAPWAAYATAFGRVRVARARNGLKRIADHRGAAAT
jgi:hypothetical protein